MLEFMKNYFPKLLSFIVAILIFLQILPPNYDPFNDNTTTSITEITEESTEETSTVEYDENDPSTWSRAQIVEFYKTAAAKTEENHCKSKQTMEMVSLSGAPALLKGTIEKAINSNTTEFDGVTGGHEKLQASDLQFASARKNGNKVIVTMIAKDQTDGVNGKQDEGTVGHLIYVIDGVDQVLKEAGVTGSFPEGSAVIEYKHAYANNIIVDTTTGLIEDGEWGYDVFVYLNGCSVAGYKLKNISAQISFKVVLV